MQPSYVPKRESLSSGCEAHLAYDLVSAGVLAQVYFNVIVQRVCVPGERPPVLQDATQMCWASQFLPGVRYCGTIPQPLLNKTSMRF